MTPVAFISSLSLVQVVPIGAALLTLALVIFIWISLIEKDPMRARMKAMAAHRDHVRARHAKKTEEKAKVTFQQRKTIFNSLSIEMRRASAETSEAARLRLAQAGWRNQEALGYFFAAKLIGPFLMFGIAMVSYYTVDSVREMNEIAWGGTLALSVILGFALPDLLLSHRAKKRGVQLERGLPDALDLLVVCTEAGLGLDASFDRVAGEVGRSHPEVADELSLTSVELNILPDRMEALTNLVKRTGISTIESVVSTLAQTERYGTPISQSFRVLANDFREARLLRAEEKAARLPATLTIPMVLFILPCLFAVLLGPAIINSLNTFK
ncbi:MAG: type II secretion system F family protein [Alphaproteobacteria bacterium]